ncbi:DUF1737 domain-containing protein [Leuconostoc mesenteroides]|uniref:DUF1737 domain-containing protein n=1 Tax=Leuconostoc mesenteroides TaxID=1245 RepID=UPI001CBD95CE|nr:DUF1737 domain-containing protein [Leuconostoc mesenteroides]MBZ1527018.1 DUF1737 domain-containing protein [Leuconostoc mesenteroides]
MKYIVLKAKSTFDLEKVVNEHIKSGWLPTGGITIQGESNFIYYQVMIKHVD